MAEKRTFMNRLLSAFRPEEAALNGRAPMQVKGNGGLLPRAYEFFSPDGGHTIIELTGGDRVALALAAYWYVATRWRAQKIAEAPLMVVEEDQENGSEEWLPDHELVPVLDDPSLDYDMGELLEITSYYLDNGGRALWVIDKDSLGVPRRLVPFRKSDFSVEPSSTRTFARFIVTLKGVPKSFDAEDVVFFRDDHGGAWLTGGASRLDVAMNWLRLGERSRQVIRELLDNAVWPSAVDIMDKDWNPDLDTYEQYKQDLDSYAAPGQKGRPFVKLGGGDFKTLSASIGELVPGEVLHRVESVVAAISGVPAVVLQYQVGMENSPWSQMGEARGIAYDDTLQPAWRRMERVMTRQLLRPMDETPTRYVRFDRSGIAALQKDRQEAAIFVSMISRVASVNERRAELDLEPSDDPRADEIPELAEPLSFGPLPGSDDDDDDDDDEEEQQQEDDDEEEEQEARTEGKARRRRAAAAVNLALRAESQQVWASATYRLLRQDAVTIAEIVQKYLADAEAKGLGTLELKARAERSVITAVLGYLKEESAPRWRRTTRPLLVQALERSTAVVAADIGISYNLLHPSVLEFATKRSGWLIREITDTTRHTVRDLISQGIKDGRTTRQISDAVEHSTGFATDRARLIARTETTTAFNGGPTEALKSVGASTGRRFTKTWSGALDDRERDEHVKLEGETVPIDQPFSNGLQYPSEPNCRCAVIYGEVVDTTEE